MTNKCIQVFCYKNFAQHISDVALIYFVRKKEDRKYKWFSKHYKAYYNKPGNITVEHPNGRNHFLMISYRFFFSFKITFKCYDREKKIRQTCPNDNLCSNAMVSLNVVAEYSAAEKSIFFALLKDD